MGRLSAATASNCVVIEICRAILSRRHVLDAGCGDDGRALPGTQRGDHSHRRGRPRRLTKPSGCAGFRVGDLQRLEAVIDSSERFGAIVSFEVLTCLIPDASGGHAQGCWNRTVYSSSAHRTVKQ